MKQGKTMAELGAELARQASSKRDIITDTREIAMANTERGPRLMFREWTGVEELDKAEGLPIRDIAHRQIGTHTGIPAKYYDKMREEAPHLLAENVNTWMRQEPKRRMVRTLDGEARAFMSDRYSRIDNIDVATVAAPILMEEAEKTGLQVVSCDVTERKLYIKATTPALQGEVKKGDVVQGGLEISNSEVGFGAVVVAPFLNRLVCLNGMKVKEGYRRAHLGGRATADEGVYELLSDETLKADDNAIMLKVRDVLRSYLKEEIFNGILDRARETTERTLEGNPVKAMEVLSATVGLTQEEGEVSLRHLIEGSDLTQWGMLNAVTRTAADLESYDRATDLEAMGGKIMDLPAGEWKQIAEAA